MSMPIPHKRRPCRAHLATLPSRPSEAGSASLARAAAAALLLGLFAAPSWAQYVHWQSLSGRACIKGDGASKMTCVDRISFDRDIEPPWGTAVPAVNVDVSGVGATFRDNGILNAQILVGSGSDEATAQGEVDYNFRLESSDPLAPPGELVPFHLQARGFAQADGEAYVKAHSVFILSNGLGQQLAYAEAWDFSGSDRVIHAFAIDTWLYLQPQVLVVSMYASAQFGSYTNARGSAQVFVDPVFTIDPAYASRYRLVDLPAASVPEPASWVLMLAGVACVGLRRRQVHRQP